MAQTKTIQLLRSSAVYANLEAAKSGIQSATGTRQDGELLLGRYWSGTGANAVIKSVIGIYHKSPDLTAGQDDPTSITAGWTFIQDITSSSEGLQQLQDEVNAIETALGIENDGTWDGYSDDEIVGDQTTITGTIDEIIGYISGLDKSADVVSGQVVTTVAQADGLVSETKANLTDIVMAGYAADTTKTGAIAATDTLEQAFNKLENAVASTTVTNADGSIVVTPPTGSATTTDVNVNVDGTTIVKSTGGALKADLTLTALTSSELTALSDSNVKEAYKMIYNTDSNRSAIGNVIKIYKDSSLLSVALLHADLTANPQLKPTYSNNTWTDIASASQTEANLALCFAYQLADGTTSVEAVPVGNFLRESEFGDGLQVTNGVVTVKVGDGLEFGSEATGNKSVKVKIDSTSSDAEDFLSVGSNGVKISGVQDAIDAAIADLDVTDTAVAGQYVSAVNETDGKVSMTRANVADAVLTGYDKGSSAPQTTVVASTDDVKTAIAKLEWQVAAANAGVDALDAEVTSSDGTNVQVKVTEVDGKITAVNITTDNTINSTDLNTKIATLDADLDASGNASHGGTFVMSGVTEVDGVITSVDSVEVEAAGAAAAVKSTIDAYTVNSKAISTNPVLNGSDIALTGYSKGADGTAVSASDSVNVAIGKLENQVDAAKAAATAAHTAVEHAAGNTHVTVSASQPDSTTGKVTYTVNETNIADADDLTAEIAARKAVDGQSGDTYTANSGANYISGATSLNNADVLLDTALKTADDAMLTQINGSNAIDVTTKASKQQTVSLKLDTTTASGNITSDMLEINSNGLMMKDTWDCGTF